MWIEFGKDAIQTLKRISSHHGVIGVMITDARASSYSTMDTNQTYIMNSKLGFFRELARAAVKAIDPTDELMVIRIKTNKYEILEKMVGNEDNSVVAIQQNSSLKG